MEQARPIDAAGATAVAPASRPASPDPAAFAAALDAAATNGGAVRTTTLGAMLAAGGGAAAPAAWARPASLAPVAAPASAGPTAADAVGVAPVADAGVRPEADPGRVRPAADVAATAGVDDHRLAGRAWVVPVDGRTTSDFGPRVHPITGRHHQHTGVDVAAPTGTDVLAATGGTVVRAGEAGGYGLLVEVDHGDGLVTRYAHLSALDVRVGDALAAGERLGAVGSTGRSTGPHLHLELRVDGEPVDPGALA